MHEPATAFSIETQVESVSYKLSSAGFCKTPKTCAFFFYNRTSLRQQGAKINAYWKKNAYM